VVAVITTAFSLALQPPRALASAFQFHDNFTDGRTPWMSDQLVARPLPKHRTTQTLNKRIHTPNIHVLSGIRTDDPSFRASEDSSSLRPLGYCDRRLLRLADRNSMTIVALVSIVTLIPMVTGGHLIEFLRWLKWLLQVQWLLLVIIVTLRR
jgi:hypothetical protein